MFRDKSGDNLLNWCMTSEGRGVEMGYVQESVLKMESRDLTLEQLKSLKKLDRFFTWSISNEDKVDVLGVLTGVKPAAFLSCFSRLERFEEVVRGLGLEVKADGYGKVFVSSDADKLSQIFEISKNGKDLKENSETRGRLLGYPETAIMAFERKIEPLSLFTYNELRRENLAIYFSRCVLSREYYTEEVGNYGEKLMLATKQYLPRTYKRIVRGWNKLKKEDWF